MRTDDIELPNNGTWIEVIPTGTTMWICNMSRGDVLVRLGNDSTSDGFILKPSDKIMAGEACYVRLQSSALGGGRLAVTQ